MSSKAFRACRCRDLSTSLSARMRVLPSYPYLLFDKCSVRAYLFHLSLEDIEVYKIRGRNGVIDIHDEVLDLNQKFAYMFIERHDGFGTCIVRLLGSKNATAPHRVQSQCGIVVSFSKLYKSLWSQSVLSAFRVSRVSLMFPFPSTRLP